MSSNANSDDYQIVAYDEEFGGPMVKITGLSGVYQGVHRAVELANETKKTVYVQYNAHGRTCHFVALPSVTCGVLIDTIHSTDSKWNDISTSCDVVEMRGVDSYKSVSARALDLAKTIGRTVRVIYRAGDNKFSRFARPDGDCE